MNYPELLDTYVETTPLQRYLVELIERCETITHTERYSGVSHQTMLRIRHNPQHPVRQQTARRIIVALLRKRAEDRKRGAVSDRYRLARKRFAHRLDRV